METQWKSLFAQEEAILGTRIIGQINQAFIPDSSPRSYEAINDTNGYISADLLSKRVIIPVSEILEKVSHIIENRAVNRMSNNQTVNRRHEDEMNRRVVDQFNTCYFEGSVEIKEIMMRMAWFKKVVYNESTIEFIVMPHFECGSGLIRLMLQMLEELEKTSDDHEYIAKWTSKLNGALNLNGSNEWETTKARVAVLEEFANKFVETDVKWVESVIYVLTDIIDTIWTGI